MNSALQSFGLAFKAKRILIGDEIFANMKKISLIILASDVSLNTRKKFLDKANFYDVELIVSFTKEQLGSSLGKYEIAAIGVLDNKLKNKIKSLLESR